MGDMVSKVDVGLYDCPAFWFGDGVRSGTARQQGDTGECENA